MNLKKTTAAGLLICLLALPCCVAPAAPAAAPTEPPVTAPPVTLAETPTLAPSPTPTPSPTTTASPSPTPSPTPDPEAVISCAGDTTLGGDPRLGQDASFRAVLRDQGQGDYGFFLREVLPYFGQDDLTLLNYEGTLTTSDQNRDKPYAFKGDPEYAQILSLGSVEAVALGNNHAMDYGEQGYQDTLAALAAEGIVDAGWDRYGLYEANGIRIGMLSFYARGEMSLLEQALADIQTLKDAEGCHAVIVSIHWGDEYQTAPKAWQRDWAHQLIDVGADLIVGHHPHILNGIERYNGRNIVYSLGNFAFGGNRNPAHPETMIYQQRFSLVDGQLIDGGFRVIPCLVSSTAGNNYQPIPVTGDRAQGILDLVNERGRLFDGGVQVTGEWQTQQ